MHPFIHTYRETRFSRQRAIDRGDATASLLKPYYINCMICLRVSTISDKSWCWLFTRARDCSYLSPNSVFAATRNRPRQCYSQLVKTRLPQFYDMFACFHHLTSQLMSIFHTCTRLFIPIAKIVFSRGRAIDRAEAHLWLQISVQMLKNSHIDV